MIPIQEDLVKSVASKINYYIDVKQREDGFNLSASPYRNRKPLYIPAPPQRPRFYGSSSVKRNRLSLHNSLQEQPSILIKRRQRTQNLSSYIPVVIRNPKQDKIVQTASKFLVSLGFGNINSSHRYKKQRNAGNENSNKLPSINDRKIYQDFIYDDTASLFKEDIYIDDGKKSPDPSLIAVDSTESLTDPLTEPPKSSTPTLSPKEDEEKTPIPSNSYSAEPVPETFGVLMHCATQTDFDSILIERQLPTNIDQEYTEIKSGKETKYVVVVKTGSVLGASTRAQVKIVLCGTEGKTGVLTLLKSETNKIKFQKGKEDHFILNTFNVGQLEKIRIGHDRPELPYAWFLDSVTVYDQTEKWIYKFPCGQWFTGEDGDKKTYRELLVEQNIPMVEDIENVDEDALLQWLARTESQDKKRGKDLHQEIETDKIQDENEDTIFDKSRSDATSLSSDSSSLVDRFTQGTVISVQNQVTTGTQTNKIPGKGYNISRDFHRPQNNSPTLESKRSDNNSEDESTSSKKTSLKDDEDDDKREEQEEEEEGKNSNSNENKKEKKQNDTQNSSESVSSKEDFY